MFNIGSNDIYLIVNMVEVAQETTEILQKLKPRMVGGADVDVVGGYIRHIESLLGAVGIAQAEVSFLPSKNQKRKLPTHGSTRIPLLIKTPSASYVLKRYDDSILGGKERLISERLEGRISPKVLVHGKTLIVEEYLDPIKWPTLEIVEKKDPKIAAEAAGKLFALLARERIHYDHEHFYDEIRLNPSTGEVRVTDLGTAESFHKVNRYYSGKYREFREMGAIEYAKFEIPCLRDRDHDMNVAYLRMMNVFKQLEKFCKKIDYFNIILMLKKTAIGMKEDLEYKGDNNAWKNVYKNFPDLLESFAKTYCEGVEKV